MSDTSLIDDPPGDPPPKDPPADDPPKDPPADDPPKDPSSDGDTVDLSLSKEQFDAVPEQFRKDGELQFDGILKSWKDQQDYIKSKSYEPPEAPKDYTFDAGEDDTLKESMAKVMREDPELGEDPILHDFRDAAHKLKLSQDQFHGVLAFYANRQAADMDPPIDPEAEKKKLGDNWEGFTGYVKEVRKNLTANGTLDDDMVAEMRMVGQTAAGVKMLTALLKYGKGTTVVPKLDPQDKASTRSELQAEIKKITKARDDGEINEAEANRRFEAVTKKYEAVVGEGEGGTSLVLNE